MIQFTDSIILMIHRCIKSLNKKCAQTIKMKETDIIILLYVGYGSRNSLICENWNYLVPNLTVQFVLI